MRRLLLAAFSRRRDEEDEPLIPELPPLRAAPILALPPPRVEAKPRHDLRNVSPRRFAEVMHELYLEGALRWEEYQMVGFPSELHPRYDSTIGALTGQRAHPDRPRDMLAEWESRVEFMRRHGGPDLHRAERALDVLKRQAEPRYA